MPSLHTTKLSYLKDKKIKIDFRVEKFFKENESFLKESYPGIQIGRIQEEFNYFLISSKPSSLFFEKLKKGIPLEYITKHKFFYNADFFVDQRVLIPRYDSESMVFDIIELCKKQNKNLKLCEVGVGSGCLGLSVLNELSNIESFLGTDISSEAIEVFTINQMRQSHRFKKTIIKNKLTDRLKDVEGEFDLILSNPPYIAKKHQVHVHHMVHEFEPHLALYLPDETYINWFEVFFNQVYDRLVSGGHFYMEGHELMLSELNELAKTIFRSSQIERDLTGEKRYLKIQK